ncbi:hypothetical protein [Pseudonocardia xishanensis]|uniref:hypothetical protein n=1 Tax=Pseudonocardia xishanensis TaxID=630995 RepID=UPI0031EF7A38
MDTTLAALTEAALDSRRLSLLWQREGRHLDTEDFQPRAGARGGEQAGDPRPRRRRGR